VATSTPRHAIFTVAGYGTPAPARKRAVDAKTYSDPARLG